MVTMRGSRLSNWIHRETDGQGQDLCRSQQEIRSLFDGCDVTDGSKGQSVPGSKGLVGLMMKNLW
jgi:hypothetical protein